MPSARGGLFGLEVFDQPRLRLLVFNDDLLPVRADVQKPKVFGNAGEVANAFRLSP